MRKFAAFWGTNNIDHQARICHSTTVAGVANTWGYGAMTNSYNDIQNAKCLVIIGGNPAEAHPVAMQHMLRAKETNRAPWIVIDPRFTRTRRTRRSTSASVPAPTSPSSGASFGTSSRTAGRTASSSPSASMAWTRSAPSGEVDPRRGRAGDGRERGAALRGRPRHVAEQASTLIWCMGATQKTVGTANVRAFSILQLALGNIGVAGGGRTSTAAIATCRARRTWGSISPACPPTTA
jgi:formate dehydrogenase major subunit